jgi:hypothetical protein
MLPTWPNEIFFEILGYLNVQELMNVEKSFAIDLPIYLYKSAHKRTFSKSIAEIENIIYTIDQDDSRRINDSRRVESKSTTTYTGHSGSFLTFTCKYVNGISLSKNMSYNRYAYKGYRDDDGINHLPYTGVSTYASWTSANDGPDGMITDDFIYERKPIG